MKHEIFYGVDNQPRHSKHPTPGTANDLVSHLKRGNLMQDKYQLNGTPSCEPFEDRFENLVGRLESNLVYRHC